MAVTYFQPVVQMVYVILGIDAYQHDRVLAVCATYQDAKRYCVECLVNTEYFDLWIEKHPVTS